ncbi:hypothetical protein B0H16DRAFT_1467451 [Mycena metata]|uniref:Uncharacterized protein n=1 Tax=Mycena metata TaxID=1033252 RepID=A0AAD7I404_9AGAR|nr:hypothetical protein B0H16DRAFT_1467451 [Mycena metata]
MEFFKRKLYDKKAQLGHSHEQNRALVRILQDRETKAKQDKERMEDFLECRVCFTTLDQPDVHCLLGWFGEVYLSPWDVTLTLKALEAAKNDRMLFSCPGCREVLYAAPTKNLVLRGLLEILFQMEMVRPAIKGLDNDNPKPYALYFFDDTDAEGYLDDDDGSDIYMLEGNI